jgi:transposase
VYASCAQEAFLEGHVTAFEVTGGVPWRHIRYDNLSPAVSKVMTGRTRKETARWFSFRSWYKSVPASSLGFLVTGLLLAAG